MSKLVIPLNELEYQDLSMVGGKAAHLRILTLQGFAVPETIIVTGKVYDKYVLGHPGVHRIVEELKVTRRGEEAPLLEEIEAVIDGLEIPESFQKLMLNYLPAIFFPHFNNAAVRHSIILKEMPTVSLPGLHKSVLNVGTVPELMGAIRQVWASHWSSDAYAYRRDNCIPHEQTSMAVIVQRMCKPDYSGICQTSYRNNRNVIKIKAGWGLPRGITGRVVPFDELLFKGKTMEDGRPGFEMLEEKIVPKYEMMVFKGAEEKIVEATPGMVKMRVLNENEQNIICEMGKRVEAIFNHPMKIIWAHDRDVYILSANQDEDSLPRESTIWMHTILSAVSGELTNPLSNSIISRFIRKELENLIKELGTKKPSLPEVATQLLGRVYINLDVVTEAFEKLKIYPDATARYLEGFSLFMKEASGGSFLDQFKPGTMEAVKINQWIEKVRETGHRNIEKVRAFVGEMKDLSYRETDRTVLGQTLERIMEHLDLLQSQVFMISSIILGLCILYKANPQKGSRDLFNEIPQVCPTFDTEFLDGLVRLYRAGSQDPQVIKLLSREDFDMGDLDPLKESDFALAMKEFVKKFYYMASFPLELSIPRLGEDPTLVFKALGHLLRSDLSANFSPAYTGPETCGTDAKYPHQQMSLLKKIIPTGSWTPDEVRKTLGDLIRMSRDKEELLFQLFSLLRSAVSAIGEDFKRASMISSSSDVHFLHIDEIIEATSSTFDDMHKLVEERKSNYKIWCDYYTPDVFSGTRLNLNPVNFEPNLGLKSTQGIPVYPGKVRGRALRVSKIEDFRRVEPDSILVVERLSPILAPFFLNASGIIIEENGPFPNDIILVRRMKKPAVSGFPGLRRMIKDGDALEIDGEQGTIQLFG